MAHTEPNYYAVHNGKQGTQIYLTWEETKANVTRMPHVKYKSFRNLNEAQAWLEGVADAYPAYLHPPVQYWNGHQRMQHHNPPAQPGGAVPAVYAQSLQQVPQAGRNNDDAMDVDSDSDIEILPGPPSTHSQSLSYEDDSDIEILDGQPADWGKPRSPSRAPKRQQEQPVAGPSTRHATPARAPPAPTVEHEVKQGSGVAGPNVDTAHVPTAPANMPVSGPVHDIQLSPDQLYVLSKVKNGESVFFTGSAGTGKSVLLREIIKHCGGRPSNRLGVTASTGIASINIGGCTLHSWAGIGLGKDDKDGLVGKILGLQSKAYKEDMKRRKELWAKKGRGEPLTADDEAFLATDPSETCKNKVLERWRKCKWLIIDEISMIDGKLFDKLEYVARKLRKNELAFGGIQLILSGDFCQLPPVPDKSSTGAQIPSCFAFDAESWNRCVGPPIVLKKVFRQKDQNFVDMLNEMRFGKINRETAMLFRQLEREVTYEDGIEPTQLYPTRKEVESANSRRLKSLPSAPRYYKALDAPGRDENGHEFPPDRVKRALEDVIVPKDLELKLGAQVMLLKNIIQGLLVNGSMGRVVAFYKPRDAMTMGAEIAIPENQEALRKAFGVSEDEKQDAGASDANGPEAELDLKAQSEQREAKLKAILALNDVFPAVQFHSGPIMLCVPLSFEVINAEGTIEAVREQVPLMLAWALSIHKSQGQTLQRVRVDLGRTFEKGQAYVALSRATSLETLQVLNFDSSKVRAHPRVLEWMSGHMQKMPELPYIQDDIDEELEYWGDTP